MKRFLTSVTLVLVTAIVGVLAVYLILIAVALIRANRNLAKLGDGLEAISNNTKPLSDDLSTINNAAVTLRNGLKAVDEHLRGLIKT